MLQQEEFDEEYMLGNILVEKSHPVTRNLSTVTEKEISEGVKLLIKVDNDILKKYKDVLKTEGFKCLVDRLEKAFLSNNRIIFSGCGATGRESITLDAMWRNFWQKLKKEHKKIAKKIPDLENLTYSIATGGDYSIIKAVEGFEDYTGLGEYQVEQAGVKKDDVIIALTGTAETASVIGTIMEGIKRNACIFLLYNVHLDENLLKIKRARQVILNDKVIKLNIATGPMAIMGSTRMQSTTMSQLTVSSALQIALSRYLLQYLDESELEEMGFVINKINDNKLFQTFTSIYSILKSAYTVNEISKIVMFQESIFSSKKIFNYLAKNMILEVFGDVEELNSTFSLPPFRKINESNKEQSWEYVVNPFLKGEDAWRDLLKRDINCLELDDEAYKRILKDKYSKGVKLEDCSKEEMLKFSIGYEALEYRKLKKGDGIIAVLSGYEKDFILNPDNIIIKILKKSSRNGIKTGLLYFGDKESIKDIKESIAAVGLDAFALIELNKDKTFLKMHEHIFVKMVLNIISTITMTRLKRVEGNCMVYMMPSNKKLYDRGARFIVQITGVDYKKAYGILQDVLAYLSPKINKGEKIIPPIVFACERIKKNLTNEEAEKIFS